MIIFLAFSKCISFCTVSLTNIQYGFSFTLLAWCNPSCVWLFSNLLNGITSFARACQCSKWLNDEIDWLTDSMYRCSGSPHGDFFVQPEVQPVWNVAVSVWRGVARPLRSCLVTRVVTGIIYMVRGFSFWPFFTHTEHKMPVEIRAEMPMPYWKRR